MRNRSARRPLRSIGRHAAAGGNHLQQLPRPGGPARTARDFAFAPRAGLTASRAAAGAPGLQSPLLTTRPGDGIMTRSRIAALTAAAMLFRRRHIRRRRSRPHQPARPGLLLGGRAAHANGRRQGHHDPGPDVRRLPARRQEEAPLPAGAGARRRRPVHRLHGHARWPRWLARLLPGRGFRRVLRRSPGAWPFAEQHRLWRAAPAGRPRN